jgi:hypothetical protein
MPIKINGTNTTAQPSITGTDTDTGLVYGTDEVKIVTGGTDRVVTGTDIVFNNASSTERLRISSEGYVTHTNPGVYLDSLDWTSSIAQMHLGHQFWQIGSNWNNSTGVWTCPVAGRYLVAADVQGHNTGFASGASSTYYNIAPFLNGAAQGIETVATQKGDSGGTGQHDSIAFTIILNCAANDSIEVRSNHGYRSNTQNHLTIYLLS